MMTLELESTHIDCLCVGEGVDVCVRVCVVTSYANYVEI